MNSDATTRQCGCGLLTVFVLLACSGMGCGERAPAPLEPAAHAGTATQPATTGTAWPRKTESATKTAREFDPTSVPKVSAAQSALGARDFAAASFRFPTAAEQQTLGAIRTKPLQERLVMLEAACAKPSELPIEYLVHAAVGLDTNARDQALAQFVKLWAKTDKTPDETVSIARAAMELDGLDMLPGGIVWTIQEIYLPAVQQSAETDPALERRVAGLLHAIDQASSGECRALLPIVADQLKQEPAPTKQEILARAVLDLMHRVDLATFFAWKDLLQHVGEIEAEDSEWLYPRFAVCYINPVRRKDSIPSGERTVIVAPILDDLRRAPAGTLPPQCCDFRARGTWRLLPKSDQQAFAKLFVERCQTVPLRGDMLTTLGVLANAADPAAVAVVAVRPFLENMAGRSQLGADYWLVQLDGQHSAAVAAAILELPTELLAEHRGRVAEMLGLLALGMDAEGAPVAAQLRTLCSTGKCDLWATLAIFTRGIPAERAATMALVLEEIEKIAKQPADPPALDRATAVSEALAALLPSPAEADRGMASWLAVFAAAEPQESVVIIPGTTGASQPFFNDLERNRLKLIAWLSPQGKERLMAAYRAATGPHRLILFHVLTPYVQDFPHEVAIELITDAIAANDVEAVYRIGTRVAPRRLSRAVWQQIAAAIVGGPFVGSYPGRDSNATRVASNLHLQLDPADALAVLQTALDGIAKEERFDWADKDFIGACAFMLPEADRDAGRRAIWAVLQNPLRGGDDANRLLIRSGLLDALGHIPGKIDAQEFDRQFDGMIGLLQQPHGRVFSSVTELPRQFASLERSRATAAIKQLVDIRRIESQKESEIQRQWSAVLHLLISLPGDWNAADFEAALPLFAIIPHDPFRNGWTFPVRGTLPPGAGPKLLEKALPRDERGDYTQWLPAIYTMALVHPQDVETCLGMLDKLPRSADPRSQDHWIAQLPSPATAMEIALDRLPTKDAIRVVTPFIRDLKFDASDVCLACGVFTTIAPAQPKEFCALLKRHWPPDRFPMLREQTILRVIDLIEPAERASFQQELARQFGDDASFGGMRGRLFAMYSPDEQLRLAATQFVPPYSAQDLNALFGKTADRYHYDDAWQSGAIRWLDQPESVGLQRLILLVSLRRSRRAFERPRGKLMPLSNLKPVSAWDWIGQRSPR